MATIEIEGIDFSDDEKKQIIDEYLNNNELDIFHVEFYIENNPRFLNSTFMKDQLGWADYIKVPDAINKNLTKIPAIQSDALEFFIRHISRITLDDLIQVVKTKEPGKELLL